MYFPSNCRTCICQNRRSMVQQELRRYLMEHNGNILSLHVFDKISQQQGDNVSWNSMIAGFSCNSHEREALEYFGKTQLAGVKLKSTLVVACILPSCVLLEALPRDKEIHWYVIRQSIPEFHCHWMFYGYIDHGMSFVRLGFE